MTDDDKRKLNDWNLQDVVDCLIEENCITPVVEAIMENVEGKINTLNKIQELLKD